MNIINRRKKTIEELRDKEYRDAFAIEHIDTGIPFQIRALREQEERGWTQEELGNRAGMAQESISRIEDPNYGKLTLKTLKRLASAFDVALMVRFVPFSELVEWELKLSPDSLKASSFEDDFKDELEEENTALREATKDAREQPDGNNITYMKSFIEKRERIREIIIPRQPVGEHIQNTPLNLHYREKENAVNVR